MNEFIKNRLFSIFDEIAASILIGFFTAIFGGGIFLIWNNYRKYLIWISALVLAIILLIILSRLIWKIRTNKWFLIISIFTIIFVIACSLTIIVKGIDNSNLLLILTIFDKFTWSILAALIGVIFSILFSENIDTLSDKNKFQQLSAILFIIIVTIIILLPTYNIWTKSPLKLDIPNSIKILSTVENTDKCMDTLYKLNNSGNIAIGKKREDFITTKNSNLFVIIIDDKNVCAIFKYTHNFFINVKNDEKITNFSNKFEGKRQIWIQDIR